MEIQKGYKRVHGNLEQDRNLQGEMASDYGWLLNFYKLGCVRESPNYFTVLTLKSSDTVTALCSLERAAVTQKSCGHCEAKQCGREQCPPGLRAMLKIQESRQLWGLTLRHSSSDPLTLESWKVQRNKRYWSCRHLGYHSIVSSTPFWQTEQNLIFSDPKTFENMICRV